MCFSAGIIRDNEVTEINNQHQITPTPADRDGFEVRCTDPNHTDLRSVSVDDVEKTSTILPRCKFLEFPACDCLLSFGICSRLDSSLLFNFTMNMCSQSVACSA